MNSRTSRPRSPMRASTETSASVPRTIIDSRLDLPTPEPAKMPDALAAADGDQRVEHADARVCTGRRTSSRRSGWGAAPSMSTRGPDDRGTEVVDRSTEAVDHPAEQAVADRDARG